MYGKLLLCGALAMSSSKASTGTINNGMPPERFRGSSVAVVVFTDREGIDRACGVAHDATIIACHSKTDNGVSVIVMPNPCSIGDREFYARIQCHENGHSNGWTGDHEE